MLAQRRTVSESKRAVVLRISTGNISGESHHTGPAKCFAYPTGPWCFSPCQLKYKNVMTAHARGTVAFAVGELKKGNTPKRFDSRMKSATLPTMGTYLCQSWPAFSSKTSLIPNPIGFVSSISAICCEGPGLSTDNLDLSS